MRLKLVLAVLISVLLFNIPVQAASAQAEVIPPSGAASSDVKPYSYADLVEKLLPAVVNVSATQLVGKDGGPQGMTPEEFMQQIPPGSPFEDFFKDFLERHGGGGQQRRTQASLGSGFIIDAQKGLVVTNNHVVADADEVNVILQDNNTIAAKVVGTDSKTDLAVLQIPTDKYPLKAVLWGESDAMRVGDPVLAIGNPFGLGGTVTSGIISARARNINAGPYDDFLQTDAAINRGNSGGPMFNLRGEVIGVNTAIFSPTGGSVGIGFAIPSQLAKSVVSQISQYGTTRRGWIGVRIQQVTPDIAENLGLGKPRGALVASVAERGPSAEADIQPGDVILSFNGKEITEMSRLPRVVAETEVSTEVPVTVWRKGETLSKVLKLGSLEKAEKEGVLEDRRAEDGAPAKDGEGQTLGMTLGDMSPALRQQFSLGKKVQGVVVTEVSPNSDAAGKNIKAGDVLTELNQRPVKTAAEILELVAAAKRQGRKTVLMLVDSKGDLRFVTLSLEEPKAEKNAPAPPAPKKK